MQCKEALLFENSTKQRFSKLTKKSVKALVAVRLVSLLLKCSLVQLLQTETDKKVMVLYEIMRIKSHELRVSPPAHEALRVELPEHGGDAPTLQNKPIRRQYCGHVTNQRKYSGHVTN